MRYRHPAANDLIHVFQSGFLPSGFQRVPSQGVDHIGHTVTILDIADNARYWADGPIVCILCEIRAGFMLIRSVLC